MGDRRSSLTFEVLTLFPEAVQAFVRAGLLGKALQRELVRVQCTNIRDFTTDRHRTVDDTPFGGGAGMVMKAEPVVAALEAIEARGGSMHRILLTPSAPRFDQRVAERLSRLDRIALICGRYEGIDDRVREHFVDECLSLGDFVLGGGEVAALAVIEAVSRLREGVLGNPDSIVDESFARDAGGDVLECPQYTRPAEFRGHGIPPVLLGGNHAAIERWRKRAARRRTWAFRPELRRVAPLSDQVELHLAIDAAASDLDPAALSVVARRHRVKSIVLLGAERRAIVPWVEATAGRVQVTAFGDLRALRKRMRQRGGDEPRVITLVPPGLSDERVIRDGRELLDTLGVGDAPVVMWLPVSPASALAAEIPCAAFAPERPGAPRRIGRQALATGSAIVDASRPRWTPPRGENGGKTTEVVELALGLLRNRTPAVEVTP